MKPDYESPVPSLMEVSSRTSMATADFASSFLFQKNKRTKPSTNEEPLPQVTRSTSSPPSALSFDELIGSKLNQISEKDRSLGLHDVHGVADNLQEETPKMMAQKQDEMDEALEEAVFRRGRKVSKVDSSAFQQARSLSSDYVQKIKLMCLRAERYDSHLAVQRLLRFFARKLELFGADKLVKDLTLSDLSHIDDRRALEAGIVQLLPQRDRAGRAVLFVDGVTSSRYSNKVMMRIIFYMAMAALHDEETQRKGIVGICHAIGPTKPVYGRPMELYKNWNSLPWRIAAFHTCMDDSSGIVLNMSLRVFCCALESRSVCRLRFHHGSSLECMYNLLTFGIPQESLPIAMDGSVDLSAHKEMLESLQRIERSETQPPARQLQKENKHQIEHKKAETIIGQANKAALLLTLERFAKPYNKYLVVVPGPMDVMMGRGRRSKNRPGPARFHTLILEHRAAYDAAAKTDKIYVTEKVLELMKESGCRFLRATPSGFVQCNDAAAREKISHGFRNLRLASTTSSSCSDGQTCRKRNLPALRGTAIATQSN